MEERERATALDFDSQSNVFRVATRPAAWNTVWKPVLSTKKCSYVGSSTTICFWNSARLGLCTSPWGFEHMSTRELAPVIGGAMGMVSLEYPKQEARLRRELG